MKEQEFIDVMTSEAPCDKCRVWGYCQRGQMACQQFASYVDGNSCDVWQTKAKAPSHAIFLRVFSDDSCNWMAA